MMKKRIYNGKAARVKKGICARLRCLNGELKNGTKLVFTIEIIADDPSPGWYRIKLTGYQGLVCRSLTEAIEKAGEFAKRYFCG